jgi:hypothetical protein
MGGRGLEGPAAAAQGHDMAPVLPSHTPLTKVGGVRRGAAQCTHSRGFLQASMKSAYLLPASGCGQQEAQAGGAGRKMGQGWVTWAHMILV